MSPPVTTSPIFLPQTPAAVGPSAPLAPMHPTPTPTPFSFTDGFERGSFGAPQRCTAPMVQGDPTLAAQLSSARTQANVGAPIGAVKTTTAASKPDGKALAAMTAQVTSDVHALSAKGGDAAQITTKAYERSAELLRAQYPGLKPEERMDMAVAMSTYSLNGPSVIGKLGLVDSGQTGVVGHMKAIQANDDGKQSAGMHLDTTKGGGTFEPRMNDGTDNQPFHTNFFVAAGYVAGSDRVKQTLVNAGNIYHETLDAGVSGGGGSIADFTASAEGRQMGQLAYDLRTGYQGDFGEKMLPAVISGGMSAAGTPPPRTSMMNDAEYEQAKAVSKITQDMRDGYGNRFIHGDLNPVMAWNITYFQGVAAASNVFR